ncbi:ATP-binding Cassette (ABC) Superfamily, partial [Thraustotheca clavata]
MISVLLVCAVSSPFILILFVPLAIVFYKIQVFYNKTSNELKRLDSVTRSPVLNLINETFHGLTTIRVFRSTQAFATKHSEALDHTQGFFLLYRVASRWMQMRLDWISSFIIAGVAILTVVTKDSIGVVAAGLALTYASQLSSTLSNFTSTYANVETIMTSVERLDEFNSLPTEGGSIQPSFTPPSSWPMQGMIQFRNFSMRYRPHLTYALKNVSFTIQSGQKVGICGRTGSGKSSLMMALFRMVEGCAGHISIDGIDISTVDVQLMRSRLTIIPQDPVLFSGSVRFNIDPSNEASDDMIWQVLKQVHLADTISAFGNGLEYVIGEKGSNFSIGQRQLFCIARALLRKSRVVLLDEATANIDLESDRLIQQTIKEGFGGVTLLLIAHRLDTIIDSDTIILMSSGEVQETGSPSELLSDESSGFAQLAKHIHFEGLNDCLVHFRLTMSSINALARRGNVLEIQRRLAQGELVDAIDETGDTALIQAAANGHHDVVQVLLEHHASTEGLREDRPSALLRATQKGSVTSVRLLASHHANLEAIFPDGKTALVYAAQHGLSLIVEVLLEFHVNTEAIDDTGSTALMYATENGNAKIVSMLLHAKAHPNVYNYARNTPLLCASINGYADVLKALLEFDVDLEIYNDDGWSALMYASAMGHYDCVKLLIEKKAKVQTTSSNGSTALLVACKKGFHEIVLLLLQNKAPVDALFRTGGLTSLMIAASQGYLSIIQLLLQFNANYLLRNQDGKTALDLATEKNHGSCRALLLLREQHPFHYYAKVGHLKPLLQLLHHNTDIDERDALGKTALMYAASNNQVDIVNYLLEQQAGVDICDNNGVDALSVAVGDCRQLLEREVLYRLVKSGDINTFRDILAENPNMDIEQRNSKGTTLLMVAAQYGQADILKLLLDQNADLDAEETDGSTAFFYATDGGHKVCRAYLDKERSFRERFPLLYHARCGNVAEATKVLDTDCDPDERDDDGWTALMYAASLGHTAMIQLLLDRDAQIGGTDKGGKTAFMVARDKAVFVKLILEKNATELRFNELMFKGAIECDPKLGKEILNAFVIESGRYSLEFRDLDRIYGRESIQQSALYSILNLEADDEAEEAVKQHCLQHVLMRRVLQLKWEFFAQRMYIEQFLMYVLLLASCVLSGCLYQLDDAQTATPPPVFTDISNVIWRRNKTSSSNTTIRELLTFASSPSGNSTTSNQTTTDNNTFDPNGFRIGIALWSVLCVYVIVGYFIAHYGLKPKRLWTLARWCRDGTWSRMFKFICCGEYIGLNWNEHIPDFPKWQRHAKHVLFMHSVFWSILFSIPIVVYILSLQEDTIRTYKNWYQAINNLVLWSIAVYFVRWEVKELMGYGFRKYFTSAVNTIQMTVYLLIVIIYVPMQLGLSEVNIVREYQLCLIGFICLALWILFLQQLEVHPTTGYLLPMMRRLLQDSLRFSILYGVFQAGLTCAYYILLQGNDGYESFTSTFVTVFFVLFGQIQTDPIDSLSDTQPVLYVFAMLLLMFHMAIAIVLLLNVLIAMMNNTLDEGLEKARMEALASYANCILRLELSLRPTERAEMIYVIKPKFLTH